jgi:hypothetical protein
MSTFVNEIIKDLKENPQTFKDYNGYGVQKDNVIVYNYGNTRVLSIVRVSVNGKDIPTSYMDKWRLEVVIKNWYKTVPLSVLSV